MTDESRFFVFVPFLSFYLVCTQFLRTFVPRYGETSE